MVNIKSVRQPTSAPQEPILGGALQGLGAFANQRITKIDNQAALAKQDADMKNKLGLAMLTAYAQQNRDIKPGGTGGIPFAGQNYAVGNKQLNPLDRKRSMELGDLAMTDEYKKIRAEKQVDAQLKTDYEFLKLVKSNKLAEAARYKQNMLDLALGNVAPSAPKQPVDLQEMFGKGSKAIKEFFGMNTAKKTVEQRLKNPGTVTGPDGAKLNISQADWDMAPPEEQQALLDAYGL